MHDWVSPGIAVAHSEPGPGTIRPDVRLVLETGDGAHVLMTYNGVGTVEDGRLRVRIAPLFQVGDSRYAWLNEVQAVGLGSPVDGGIAAAFPR